MSINMKNKRFTLIRTVRKDFVRMEAFTLIELLVVISIMGILLALSVFGMQQARQASRDGRRKADLEQIRSALEMFKSDCNKYYIGSALPSSLVGNTSYSSTCLPANIYISQVPVDPLPSTNRYSYSSDGTTYVLCAALEQASSMDVSGCGSCGDTACNYKVKNP
jgi:general secretion pathway protein G